MIVAGHRAPRYVLVALRHGAKFRGEARLPVFLLPRCGFPVVCYSQRVFNMFKSSVIAQEELVRTRKGYPSRRYVPLDLLPADLISAPCACARPRALHALRMLLSTCAGKAATRNSLGSRLTVAGRHFHLFALLKLVSWSCSELALVEFVFVLPVSSAGVAYP